METVLYAFRFNWLDCIWWLIPLTLSGVLAAASAGIRKNRPPSGGGKAAGVIVAVLTLSCDESSNRRRGIPGSDRSGGGIFTHALERTQAGDLRDRGRLLFLFGVQHRARISYPVVMGRCDHARRAAPEDPLHRRRRTQDDPLYCGDRGSAAGRPLTFSAVVFQRSGTPP